MYEVRADVSRHCVILILKHDYNHDRDAVHQDFVAAAERVRSEDGHFDVLVDLVGIHVIAQERVDSGEVLMRWCVTNGMRRGAIAVGTMLQELQLKRLSERSEKFRYFRSVDEAERWLGETSVEA
ncbi:hypothetical protein [Erythrobacter mangrovi]|uniref:STAS/SEC14 domain-containing protein n=1 Tax=Erythrobacter mangrovi TaxID=2739433 RepID=A0A7D3XAD5_9SPHN|nr:hypothetical protein [Erythrobacter mangrovi]QKG70750.1 hypothetical protein HQR01_04850 [Erythrobacter mangrovi]